MALVRQRVAELLVLLVNNLQKRADVDVVHLADWHVDKGVRVDDFHGVLTHQLELHDHHVVLDVLQVNGVAVVVLLLLNLSLVNGLAV